MIIFDPILPVALAMMLGFYILSNSILLVELPRAMPPNTSLAFGDVSGLNVSSIPALNLHCTDASALLEVAGVAYRVTRAYSASCLLAALAIKLRAKKSYARPLAFAGLISVGGGIASYSIATLRFEALPLAGRL